MKISPLPPDTTQRLRLGQSHEVPLEARVTQGRAW